MKTLFKFTSVFVIVFAVHSAVFAAPANAQHKADADKINSACAQEAATAGCSGKVVGQGLLKCLSGYKKANKSFKSSPDCKAAIKQYSSDKKAGKK